MGEKRYSKLNLLIWILSLPISYLYFISLRYLLPRKFYFDTNTIRSFMENGASMTDYTKAGNFYKRLGFKYDTPIVYEIILASIVFFLFTTILVFIINVDFSKLSIDLIYLCVLCFFGPFYSMISKDLITFIFILFAMLFFNTKIFKYILIVVVLIYALNFRKYWLITLCLFIILFIAFKFLKRKTLWIVIMESIFLLLISITYNIFTGQYISSQRLIVNSARINSDNAKTITKTLLVPNCLSNDLINTIYNFVNLIFPIDGIGSFNELIYYIWLYTVFGLIYFFRKKMNKNEKIYLIFFASFLFTQSLFEPDMGSAFRHQFVISSFIPFFTMSSTGEINIDESLHQDTVV